MIDLLSEPFVLSCPDNGHHPRCRTPIASPCERWRFPRARQFGDTLCRGIDDTCTLPETTIAPENWRLEG